MLVFDLPMECIDLEAVKRVSEQDGKKVFSVTIDKELYERLPDKIKKIAKVEKGFY